MILNENTFEERLSFKLTRLNVFWFLLFVCHIETKIIKFITRLDGLYAKVEHIPI